MGSLYATLDELTNGLTNVNLQCVCCNDSVSGILFFSTKENAERAVEKLDKSTLEGRVLHLRLIPNPFLSSNEPEIKKTPNKKKHERKPETHEKQKQRKTNKHTTLRLKMMPNDI